VLPCHGGINFTDNHIQQGQAIAERGFHNTGLYNEDGLGAYKSWDHGLRGVTGNEDDEGAFRTPTLRNVAVTAPYMHDGSVATLRDVILHHYAVKGHAALGPSGANPLRSEFIEGFKLSETETRDLIAFLESLTDETFLHNPEFSDPSANSANATVPAHTKERGVHGKSK
jgi:cytochrome c peroxidase